jgi:capsular polysaccharide biosynthesis protein
MSQLFEKQTSQVSEIDTNDQFNYDIILDKASFSYLVSKSSSLYILVGLCLGFFLSLLIIFLRNILMGNEV